MDTIFALATAPGKSGVAVIRVSGPAASAVCKTLCGSVPRARQASLRSFRIAGELVDRGLVLFFEENQSFTGEPVVEFHLHGSMAIVRRLLGFLGDQPGCRGAEPGEFTRRALENDRLDLTEVEGLGDLIEAETEAQRQQAMRVFSGDLGARVETWRAKLLRAAALLEATIDFVDEDVPVDVRSEVSELLESVRRDLRAEAAGVEVAERVREGFEVALVGPPNIGKSTLLNHLARRDAALISDIAGTTRDVLEVRMDLRGLPVTFLDTAGLRSSDDVVERLGIERTRERAAAADLRVFLTAGDSAPDLDPRSGDLILRGKDDAGQRTDGVSGKTGAGVDRLIAHVVEVLSERTASVGVAVRDRHRLAMLEAEAALAAAVASMQVQPDLVDLTAEEIRTANRRLDALVGRIDVETVLDEIFSRFCIGK